MSKKTIMNNLEFNKTFETTDCAAKKDYRKLSPNDNAFQSYDNQHDKKLNALLGIQESNNNNVVKYPFSINNYQQHQQQQQLTSYRQQQQQEQHIEVSMHDKLPKKISALDKAKLQYREYLKNQKAQPLLLLNAQSNNLPENIIQNIRGRSTYISSRLLSQKSQDQKRIFHLNQRNNSVLVCETNPKHDISQSIYIDNRNNSFQGIIAPNNIDEVIIHISNKGILPRSTENIKKSMKRGISAGKDKSNLDLKSNVKDNSIDGALNTVENSQEKRFFSREIKTSPPVQSRKNSSTLQGISSKYANLSKILIDQDLENKSAINKRQPDQQQHIREQNQLTPHDKRESESSRHDRRITLGSSHILDNFNNIRHFNTSRHNTNINASQIERKCLGLENKRLLSYEANHRTFDKIKSNSNNASSELDINVDGRAHGLSKPDNEANKILSLENQELIRLRMKSPYKIDVTSSTLDLLRSRGFKTNNNTTKAKMNNTKNSIRDRQHYLEFRRKLSSYSKQRLINNASMQMPSQFHMSNNPKDIDTNRANNISGNTLPLPPMNTVPQVNNTPNTTSDCIEKPHAEKFIKANEISQRLYYNIKQSIACTNENSDNINVWDSIS